MVYWGGGANFTFNYSNDSYYIPPSCAVVTKSENLNFLEPSGPVQACNGTALTTYTFEVNNAHAGDSILCIISTSSHYINVVAYVQNFALSFLFEIV